MAKDERIVWNCGKHSLNITHMTFKAFRLCAGVITSHTLHRIPLQVVAGLFGYLWFAAFAALCTTCMGIFLRGKGVESGLHNDIEAALDERETDVVEGNSTLEGSQQPPAQPAYTRLCQEIWASLRKEDEEEERAQSYLMGTIQG